MARSNEARRIFWTTVASAAAVLAVTMGIRQSMGLFVSPLDISTGLGVATISFAMAVAQLVWGAAQPVFGMLADRAGSFKVIVLGTLLLALGLEGSRLSKAAAMNGYGMRTSR